MHLTIRAPRHVKQKLSELQGETDNSTITIGDFDTPLSIMDGTTKQKSNKKKNTLIFINKLDLKDIYRTFHPTADYTLLKNTWNIKL